MGQLGSTATSEDARQGDLLLVKEKYYSEGVNYAISQEIKKTIMQMNKNTLFSNDSLIIEEYHIVAFVLENEGMKYAMLFGARGIEIDDLESLLERWHSNEYEIFLRQCDRSRLPSIAEKVSLVLNIPQYMASRGTIQTTRAIGQSTNALLKIMNYLPPPNYLQTFSFDKLRKGVSDNHNFDVPLISNEIETVFLFVKERHQIGQLVQSNSKHAFNFQSKTLMNNISQLVQDNPEITLEEVQAKYRVRDQTFLLPHYNGEFMYIFFQILGLLSPDLRNVTPTSFSTAAPPESSIPLSQAVQYSSEIPIFPKEAPKFRLKIDTPEDVVAEWERKYGYSLPGSMLTTARPSRRVSYSKHGATTLLTSSHN